MTSPTTPLTAAELDEIDRRLATEVMGWKFTARLIDGAAGTYWSDDKLVTIVCSGSYWKPTRNIAQAWECLEKIGRPVTIDSDGDCSWSGWSCWIAISSHEYAETAPLAIARACLAAVSSADGLKK